MEKGDYVQASEKFWGAAALHQNFYENWLTAEMVVVYTEAVKSLVEKLKKLAR